MKMLFRTTALVALLAAGPALAQDATTPADTTAPAATTTEAVAPAGRFIVLEDGSTDWLASNLMGSTVYSGTDENLGKIVDILATDAGQVKAVVIGVGGFLGIGRKDVAVSPSTLERVQIDNGVKLVLKTTKEELNTAPEFKTAAQQESSTVTSTPETPDTTMPAADPATPAPATPAPMAPAPTAPETAPAAP
ncbi:PRC-barrel domain-containing protein [Kaistia terrae]|uniref:PRC-barrel domain-containing protein n=1 Tax=Kaistia terrae TaxID=537017 RepID=A0ABW0PTI9_9HYPH|nr:PRC-barrel domain-containing protein [Kaistia terrae]MCX5578252.1 PRC-barrel domain-containing protein [Kaistia terrae]